MLYIAVIQEMTPSRVRHSSQGSASASTQTTQPQEVAPNKEYIGGGLGGCQGNADVAVTRARIMAAR